MGPIPFFCQLSRSLYDYRMVTLEIVAAEAILAAAAAIGAATDANEDYVYSLYFY